MKRVGVPPLPWLRAFEAAGRLHSFKAAAAALNVSPSTVSHQVRDLERWLGVPLFSRGKPIGLTTEGERYLVPLTSAFDLIRAAGDTVDATPQSLKIGAFPFLINEVLVPNVASLRRSLGIDRVSFHVETGRAALLRADPADRLDVLVRYHDGSSMPGLVVRELFNVDLVPVKAPGSPPIENVAALMTRPFVGVLGPFDGWQAWAQTRGVETRPSRWALETDSYHAALLAVARGEGVCLGILPLIRPWLDSGRVEAVESLQSRIFETGCLVYAPHQESNVLIARLADWLIDQLT